ncbi:MAG TPA: adenylate/guanylate cyclase domain-containing protein [Usitatibacter sp.]|nr:adenylate/guanylate cyclase domain-containing protein [Usitatibacter sp.]
MNIARALGLKNRLQHRIVLFFVFLLMAVQLASFLAIRYAIEQTAQNSLREEMRVGARVFKRLLEQNSQQLVEATSVLTYDFGFREAIATRDRDTIVSALRNHAARIKASGMSVIGLDGKYVADTHDEANAGRAYPYPDLVQLAAVLGRTSGIRMMGTKPFQVVVVPVLAPLPIAWVSMTFVMDDSTARDIRRLTSAEVSFVRLENGNAEVLATTLPPSRRDSLVAQAAAIIGSGREGLSSHLGSEEFELLATPLDDTRDLKLYAILQRSVAEGHAPYLALQAVLLFLTAIALAVTLIGSIRIARRITRPVDELAGAAAEIAAGNYDVRVRAVGNDELGALARSFDTMVQKLTERDNIRDALGKVASSEVVEKLLQGQIELGGEERDVTVMFTDVRNFTALAEELSPQQSLVLLNEFLTAISEVVEEHGGVVDKYLGDGVMAIFGAPVTRDDDPQRALECALMIRRRVEGLGPTLEARGLPHPEIGLGMNTARVIAGNMGSPSRLNYTVLGDGVNLASRLEGLTKRYHVPIVVGSRTRESVAGMVWRELDKVRVKGKTVPERIFEPIGREGEVGPAELGQLERWHAALEAFRERRWAQARAGFETLADERGYVRLVAIYLGYLRDLRSNPPGEDWDAAFTLYEK